MECGDERQAYLFDDRGVAVGRDGGFELGQVGRERLVAEDARHPAGELMAGAVVAQHAPVAAAKLRFQFVQVGRDRPGGGIGPGLEVEPAGGLDAGLPVLMRVPQMGCGPGPEGERHRPAGALSPGQHRAAARPGEKAGDLGAGHIGHRRGDVDELAVGPGGAEGDDGVEGQEGVGRQLQGLPGDEQVALGGGVEHAARGHVPPDRHVGLVDDHPLRYPGGGPVGLDFAGEVRHIGRAGRGVEVGQVGDHAGVAVPEQAHDLGGVGEAALMTPGDDHVA